MMCDIRSMKGLRFLLLLLLALPAMQARAHQDGAAPGHAMAHEMAMHDMAMHHGDHREAPVAPAPHATHHDCIGCIAPIDIRLYRAAEEPQPKAGREPRPADIAFLLAGASAPEPPPPRVSV